MNTGWRLSSFIAAVAALGVAGAMPLRAQSPAALEIVVTGVTRPLQLAIDGRTLIVLGPGARGDVAAEIYRVDLGGELPIDLSRQPRVRIPFLDARMATLGSFAVDPATRALYLGEENGSRVYRLGGDEGLALYATGLHRVPGGSALAFDGRGRLVLIDYVDPQLSDSEERPPPGLEQFRDEDYRGSLVFRLPLDAGIPLPRRLDRRGPLFPRNWAGRSGASLLPRLIAVAPVGDDKLLFLTSSGDILRLTAEGGLTAFARLPPGQYNRTNMVGAPDGGIFVSGGFHVGSVFRVSAEGVVTTIATRLADPQGIALDARGAVYIAESSFHRIVRVRP